MTQTANPVDTGLEPIIAEPVPRRRLVGRLSLGHLVMVLAGVFAVIIGSLTGHAVANLTAWYSGATLTQLVLVALLVGYGFVISLGGRPLLRDAALEA